MAYEETIELVRNLSEHKLKRDPSAKRVACGRWDPNPKPLKPVRKGRPVSIDDNGVIQSTFDEYAVQHYQEPNVTPLFEQGGEAVDRFAMPD